MADKQFDIKKFTRPEDLFIFFGSARRDEGQSGCCPKCVIYIRKSRVIPGKEHYSDVAQEEHCRAQAEQQGWDVAGVFIDLDRSGKNSKRSEFQRMLDLIKTGAVDTVLVHHLDRVYRNGFSFAMFMAFIQEYNVELVSLSENLDSRTFPGRLMMMVLGATAEWPVWAASERSREAKEIRFRRGLHNGGYRLGYCDGCCSTCNDPNGKGYCPLFGCSDRPECQDGTIQVPHPIEKYAVLLIVSNYQTGMSDKEIADHINNHSFGLPNGSEVRFRTKGVPGSFEPGLFTRDSVREIVRNPFYPGYVAHYPTPSLNMADDLHHPARIHNKVRDRRTPLNLVRGQHEPLYPFEVWKQNQQLRMAKKKTPTQGGKPAHIYLLTGIARCAMCEEEDGRVASLRGTTNGSGNQTYRCATICDRHHSHRSKADLEHILPTSEFIAHGTPEFGDLIKRHSRTSLPANELDAQATALLQKFTIPSDWYDRILAYMFSEYGMSEFERQGHTLYREFERYKTLYLDGHISQDEYDQQAARMASALDKLKPTTRSEAREILPLLADFPSLWEQMTPLEKRTILKDIFACMYFNGQGKLVEARPHAPFVSLLESL